MCSRVKKNIHIYTYVYIYIYIYIYIYQVLNYKALNLNAFFQITKQCLGSL